MRKPQPNIDFTTALSNSLGEGVYALDREGLLIYLNPAAERMLGWTQAELLGKDMHQAIHFQRADGTPLPAEECPLLAVMESEVTVSNDDDVFTRKDGQTFPVTYTSAPMRLDGEMVGAVLSFRDITERKRGERRLAAQYTVTRILGEAGTMAEAAPHVLRAICESLHWNLGALWLLDQDAAEQERLRCAEIWHQPTSDLTEFGNETRTMGLGCGEGLPGRVWSTHKSIWIPDVTVEHGFARSASASAENLHGAFAFPVLLGNELLGVLEFFCQEIREPDEDVLNMIASISTQLGQFIERNRAEAALRESEGRYRFLAEAMPQQVWTARSDGALDYVNQRVLDYFACTMEEMLGWGWQGVVHPDDLAAATERWTTSLRTGEIYATEFRLKRASDNSYRWHLSRALPVRDASGRIIKWFGTNTEIEEQKRLEEGLAEISRERERMLEEVSTPVVPVWRGVLALPLIGSLDTLRMQRATEAALGSVMRTGARACIIDITGARLVDSHAVANLGNLVMSLKLIGAEAVVTGVGAHASQTLIRLGIDLTGIRTCRTFAEALAALIKSQQNNNHQVTTDQ